MESEVLKMAASYGVFAILFCYLLFYVLKENGKREAKYQEIIASLTEKFTLIENGLCGLGRDIGEIKTKIFK